MAKEAAAWGFECSPAGFWDNWTDSQCPGKMIQSPRVSGLAAEDERRFAGDFYGNDFAKIG